MSSKNHFFTKKLRFADYYCHFLRKRRFGACSGSKKRLRNNVTAEEGATNPPFSSVKGFNILYIEKNRPTWYTLYCVILYINGEFPQNQMISRGRG